MKNKKKRAEEYAEEIEEQLDAMVLKKKRRGRRRIDIFIMLT